MIDMSRKVSCTVCPLSCSIKVEITGGEIRDITGFGCLRGQEYASEEVNAPKRMLTTTVRVLGGRLKLLPVVSQEKLPKDKVLTCARHLAGFVVNAPVAEGQVICADILGLGVDVVAARSILAEPG